MSADPSFGRIYDLIGRAACAAKAEEAAEIEQRILNGENDFVVMHPTTRSATRYIVPSWWSQPRRRARVELARWRHRRAAVDPVVLRGKIKQARGLVHHLDEQLQETELRLATAYDIIASVPLHHREEMDVAEDGLLTQLGHALGGDCGHADPEEWQGNRRSALERHRADLVLPHRLNLDGVGLSPDARSEKEASMFPMPDLDPELKEGLTEGGGVRPMGATGVPTTSYVPDEDPFAVAVVVDFLGSWRYCPVSRASDPSRSCLEDAAKQLLAALGDVEGVAPLFMLDAEQARIVQEFVAGTRRAAANPQERELLKRLRVFVGNDPRPNSRTIWCEEGKHDECKGWGETVFQVPRQRAECHCPCHRDTSTAP